MSVYSKKLTAEILAEFLLLRCGQVCRDTWFKKGGAAVSIEEQVTVFPAFFGHPWSNFERSRFFSSKFSAHLTFDDDYAAAFVLSSFDS